jgi:hypothetical protein
MEGYLYGHDNAIACGIYYTLAEILKAWPFMSLIHLVFLLGVA